MNSALLQRFLGSMVLDFDKWHDGIGYDLDALFGLDEHESAITLAAVEESLRSGSAGWRDVDAISALVDQGAAGALDALQRLRDHPNAEVRIRVAGRQSEADANDYAEAQVVMLLMDPDTDAGIDALIALAEAHPTAAVHDALLWCAVDGCPRLRVHAAALWLYNAGGATEVFEWKQRPLFLRFAEEDRDLRQNALRDLKARATKRGPDANG